MASRPTAQANKPNPFARWAKFPSYAGRRLAAQLEQADFQPPEPIRLVAAEQKHREAICATPDAMGPRLRYAEWLEREGDPRGEWIRVQLALAELPEQMAWSPSRDRLLERERQLLLQHGTTWLNELAAWPLQAPEFRRGFVEFATLTGRAFLSLGESLMRATPLQGVRLIAIAPYLAELGKSHLLAQLRELDLRDISAGNDGIGEVIASPHGQSVQSLTLANNRLDAHFLRMLAASTHWHALQKLDLSRNPLGPTVGAELLALPHLVTLSSLNLSESSMGIEGASLLAARSGLQQLRTLQVAGNRLGASGVAALMRSPYLQELSNLNVADNHAGPAGIASLTTASLPKLRQLDVSGNDLGDLGIRTLAQWESLSQVHTLKIRNNRLTDEASRSLNAARLPELRRLDLTSNRLGDRAAYHLTHEFSTLRVLRLTSNFITDFGCRSMLRSEWLPQLRDLDLSYNRLSDAGAISLAECESWRALERLNLAGNNIGLSGALTLADSDLLQGVRCLDLRENPRIPIDAADRLRERFGARVLL